MLARLAEGEATVTELAEPFRMSVQAVSKHLKVLERAGLVTRSRSAQQRPAQLDGRHLADAAEWLDRYRRLWDASFDRMEDYLRSVRQRADPSTTTTHEEHGDD